MNKIRLKANAKINIGLRILGKRSDGYHNIESIFQEIDFGDIVEISKSKKFNLIIDGADLPADESNLCYKAWKEVCREISEELPIQIQLEKRIPTGAGLGGGSSDAAAIIRGMDVLFDLQIPELAMSEIAGRLGADVPFFLEGGSKLVSGIGEILEPCDFLPNDFTILLIFPDFNVSTSWAYQNYTLPENQANNKLPRFFRKDSDWKLFENDFEHVIFHAYPEAGQIKKALYELGAKLASLSGSGSTMYGIFDNHYTARRAADYFSREYETELTVPIQ